MREDERNFVLANWLRSYATSDFALLSTPKDATHGPACNECGRRMVRVVKDDDGRVRPQTGPAYWVGHRRLVEGLVSRCNVSVMESEIDGLLDGFICRDQRLPILHYLYVRQSSRGKGVAKTLVADLLSSPTTYTHRSARLDAGKIPAGWTFSLYEAFR